MFKTLSKTSLLKSTFSLSKSSFRAPKSVPVNNYSTNIEVFNLKTDSSNFDKDQFEKLLKRLEELEQNESLKQKDVSDYGVGLIYAFSSIIVGVTAYDMYLNTVKNKNRSDHDLKKIKLFEENLEHEASVHTTITDNCEKNLVGVEKTISDLD